MTIPMEGPFRHGLTHIANRHVINITEIFYIPVV